MGRGRDRYGEVVRGRNFYINCTLLHVPKLNRESQRDRVRGRVFLVVKPIINTLKTCG